MRPMMSARVVKNFVHPRCEAFRSARDATPVKTTTEFAELLAQPDERIDLARAALLIAADAYPHLEADRYLRALDELADPLRTRIAASSDPYEKLAALRDHLHGDLGFRANREDYYDPRNSYLNEVLDRRLGIPISLSLVYVEVARRAGLPLHGVGLPGHFLVGYRDDRTEVFLDPFDGGRTVDEAACRALVAEVYRSEERRVGKECRL